MNDESRHLPFPTESDLAALVEDVEVKSFRRMMATRGVFAYGGRDAIAPFVARFAFPRSWYANIFERADLVDSGGVNVTGEWSLDVTVEQVRTAAGVLQGAELRSKYSPKLTGSTEIVDGFTTSVSYVRTRPHRARIFARDDLRVEIHVRRLTSGGVELFSYPRTTSDALVVRNVISKLLAEAKGTPVELDLERLPLASRISLFDSLKEAVRGGAWRFRDREVTGYRLRHERGDDDGDEEITEEILRSATLEGKNLREHEFVVNLLEKDYYFGGMKGWIYHPDPAQFHGDVQVELSFKRKPANVMVVTVGKARERDDDGVYQSASCPPEAARIAAYQLWSDVHSGFLRHYNREHPGAKKVGAGDAGTGP